ncbi:hypothetical protein O7634_10610 [Micromonospora sp. WMMD1120]|uniref:helix-turn-helix domain-containing protein n=1 Tax=Micromonospora sp. WMMD1120 TaxID=3016106 RepID=UPI0024176F3A|nr:helix-turn-helix domain-containing protein [Micromonospora sp. WMMD1120]MDG4807198.1 hypothetical protein [Micromonospora sp. WMMD1120]
MGTQVDPSWWTSGVWEGQPIRVFLKRRDIAATFRFLHARGVSYGTIAALVGVSANRAAEITKGRRQVTAYEVLERIAVGLGIPRAVMGLGQGEMAEVEARRPLGRQAGASADLPSAERTANRPDQAIAMLARLRIELDEGAGLLDGRSATTRSY